MVHLIIGAVTMAGLLLVYSYSRKKDRTVKWWQWLLTILAFAYGVFTLEVIVSFLEEGVPKGALVLGTILGFIAVVWAFLLARFVFSRKAK